MDRYPEALEHFEMSRGINETLASQLNLGFDLMNRGACLWQLGRRDEARASLDRAAAIAAHPESGYGQLLAVVFVSRAGLELSQRRLNQAEALARKAIALGADNDRELAIQAKCVIGLAQALSGRARAGSEICGEALELAEGLKNPRLVADAELALSEVTRLNGDPRAALSYATRAEQFYSRHNQVHSEWLALLSMASAEMMAGDRASAREHASRAAGVLSGMRQSFGEPAYTGYLSRPDIQDYNKRIESLLSANQ